VVKAKDAREKWTSHAYQLSNSATTEFFDPPEGIPLMAYNGTNISDLPNLEVGTFHDIVALVTVIQDPHPSGRLTQLVLTDKTGKASFLFYSFLNFDM